LDTIRSSLEGKGDSDSVGRTAVIVLDQVTALFKDQLVNTNSAGMYAFYLRAELMIGQAAMMGVMEDIAELTYSHALTTFVSPLQTTPKARSESSV
jgi:hypothetical protein